MPMMGAFPRLARYTVTSPFPGVILLLTGPHSGTALYVPEALTELNLGDHFSPANSELEDYTGSVILRNSADPQLGE